MKIKNHQKVHAMTQYINYMNNLRQWL